MPACDMCGREGPTNKAIVEGSMMNICNRCSKFGNVVEVYRPPLEVKEPKKERFVPPERNPLKKQEPKPIMIVVSDYALRIRAAREKALLSQEELAKAIAEKESVVQKIEASQFEPPFSLARKLERFLKVELIEELKKDDSEKSKNFDLKNNSLTIGDLIKFRKS